MIELIINVNYLIHQGIKVFPVSLQNRIISDGLQPVLSHTDKLCVASHYIQCSMNIYKNV